MATIFDILAAGCAGLFLLLAARALWALGRPSPLWQAPARAGQARAMGAALAFGAAVELVFVAAALRENPGAGLGAAVENFFGFYPIDANHYRDIARYGYAASGDAVAGQELLIVFFPLYPLLLRLANPLGALPWHLIGMLLQLPLFTVGAGLFYRLAARLLGPHCAAWALAFLLMLPGSFFFLTPMSDSLFLLLTGAFLLALAGDCPALAGLFGLLAGLCRAPGVLLAGAAGAYYLGRLLCKRAPFRPIWGLPVAGPVAGLGVYLAINQAVYGDLFRFAFYQSENWNQRLGFFWETIRYHGQNFLGWLTNSPDLAWWLCFWAVGTLAVSLLALAAGGRLPAFVQLHGLAYYAVTNGATWLLSAPRYSLNSPALPLSLACLPRLARRVALGLLAVAWAVFFGAFLSRAPIY